MKGRLYYRCPERGLIHEAEPVDIERRPGQMLGQCPYCPKRHVYLFVVPREEVVSEAVPVSQGA